jgi:hypothetical protein
MLKKLLKSLFTTFIFSVILTIAATCVYYTIAEKSKGYDYKDVIPLIISGALFLNLILLLMAAPIIFLSYPHIYSNRVARLLLYFAGPLLFIITILFLIPAQTDRSVYLIAGITFVIVHSWFYYKLVKKNN